MSQSLTPKAKREKWFPLIAMNYHLPIFNELSPTYIRKELSHVRNPQRIPLPSEISNVPSNNGGVTPATRRATDIH